MRLVLPRASDIDEHPLYYYFYGYNILLTRTGNWADVLSPFRTLGVEEQLYLVGPCVVFLTPRRALRRVIGASRGFGGWVGTVLNNRAVQYAGRISYGLYVFHMLVPGFLVPLLLRMVHRPDIRPALGQGSYRLVSLVALLALASLSYYAVEKPINHLKRYFAYH